MTKSPTAEERELAAQAVTIIRSRLQKPNLPVVLPPEWAQALAVVADSALAELSAQEAEERRIAGLVRDYSDVEYCADIADAQEGK